MLLVALKFDAKEEVSSDAALAQRLLRRDVNAFEQLYDRHSRIVYSVVLRILRRHNGAVPSPGWLLISGPGWCFWS